MHQAPAVRRTHRHHRTPYTRQATFLNEERQGNQHGSRCLRSRPHKASQRTFLNSSAHSAIDIFWIESAWPDGAEDCVCAKRARHVPDTRAAPQARLGTSRRSMSSSGEEVEKGGGATKEAVSVVKSKL